MGSSLDIARILSENEEARQLDAEDAKQKYDQMLQNDADILKVTSICQCGSGSRRELCARAYHTCLRHRSCRSTSDKCKKQ